MQDPEKERRYMGLDLSGLTFIQILIIAVYAICSLVAMIMGWSTYDYYHGRKGRYRDPEPPMNWYGLFARILFPTYILGRWLAGGIPYLNDFLSQPVPWAKKRIIDNTDGGANANAPGYTEESKNLTEEQKIEEAIKRHKMIERYSQK